MDKYLLVGIILLGACLFVVSLCTHKIETFINFSLRILMGGLAIYCINGILASQGLKCLVGINGVSLTTIGILGLPGFLALYGVCGYFYAIKQI